MANEELLKKAVESFDAFSPEQKATMLEEQRQSWVRGNVGLSRDERGITTPVMPLPAAPAYGLETVGWLWEYAQYRTDDRGYYGYETVITENSPTEHVSPAEKLRNVRELVTLSQAEAIIAAERQRAEEAERDANEQSNVIFSLQANNAALTARVKELENKLAGFCEGV